MHTNRLQIDSSTIPESHRREDDESISSATTAGPPPLIVDDVLARLHETSGGSRKILTASRKAAKPRLTLSAFRRPQDTIRLTNADPKRRLEDRYDLHNPQCGVLGHGAFSVVRSAVRRKDGVQVAVKSIAKHNALRSKRLRVGGQRYLEEWEILRRMHHHPYIVTLLDVFETHDEIQLVMEYCSGGELFNALQKRRNKTNALRRGQYSESQASRIASQMLWALRDLHAQNIVHRDIKPENILLSEEGDDQIHAKLCDFGTARNLSLRGGKVEDPVSPFTPSRSRALSMIGSNYYVAPEISYGANYGTAVDVYSLGATVYIILCGFPPVFDQENRPMFPNSYWKDISESAKDFVLALLNPDPETRPSAEEALRHTWVSRSTHDDSSPASIPIAGTRHEIVRSRVRQSFDANSGSTGPIGLRKRPRVERSSSTALMALADLYHGRATSPLQRSRKSHFSCDEDNTLHARALPCQRSS